MSKHRDNGMRVAVFTEGGLAMELNKSSDARRIIDTDEERYDVMYWSIKFGVSIQKLIETITKVGPLVMNVERHLSASIGLMVDPSGADRDPSIIRPDPSLFLGRNDRSGGVETAANEPRFSQSKSTAS
jgi:Protein of unknown function (DUF3606)